MHYPSHIKRKNLYRKTTAMLEKMQYGIRGDLQFEAQEEEVKRHFYHAIDDLKKFIDNIDYGLGMEEWEKKQK